MIKQIPAIYPRANVSEKSFLSAANTYQSTTEIPSQSA